MILLTGWSPENVGRVFGVFHETRISQDLLQPKGGTGRTDKEKSKFSSHLSTPSGIIYLFSHILPSICCFSSKSLNIYFMFCVFCQLLDPMLETQSHSELLSAVRLLVSEDHCDGRFVFGRQVLPQSKKETNSKTGGGAEGKNYKNHLQAFLNRAGHDSPTYKTKELKNNQFRTTVVFNGLNFVGQPCSSKKLAEKSAAAEALLWIKGDGHSSDDIDHASVLLKKSNKKSRKNSFSSAKWS